jgi:CDGSH-type Zn-finger protein
LTGKEISTESNGGVQEVQQKEKPRILPIPHGPYYLINDMEPKIIENLENSKGERLSTIGGVSLCRYGASKNKPFCDETHGKIGFSSENKDNAGEQTIKDKRKIM